MTRPTAGERLALARLGAGRVHAAARAHLGGVPLLGRRLIRPVADELMFLPSDLRPADPGVLDDLRSGQLGLGGLIHEFGATSPFALPGAAETWLAELNGFGWLGGLREARHPDATEIARQLVADWCQRHRGRPGGTGHGRRPKVIARRVISWIGNAGLLLEGAPPQLFRTVLRALGRELRALDASLSLAAPGLERMTCLMALTIASLAIKGHDRDLPRIEAALVAELGAQILPDGGHVSRNGEALVEILLDLLPVSQCYAARGLPLPPPIADALARTMAWLREMAGTTRFVPRFNGVGVAQPEALATVLSLDPRAPFAGSWPGPSGYARLVRGGTTLVADCGPPPPLEHATGAHAGCLSFELSDGGVRIIVNRGAPPPSHRALLADARATASHSTLAVSDSSSSHLVRSRAIERLAGAPPISGPETVTARIDELAEALRLVASHDGYLVRFGLIHTREMVLAADGSVLDGRDRLGPPRGTLRLARDVPFAIYFHAPVGARVRSCEGGAVIETAGAPPWWLTATGCQVSIETATDYAQVLGPTPARKIVLRAACPGDAEIAWRLARRSE
jgi:uncharacterized heparinase superfamily protein